MKKSIVALLTFLWGVSIAWAAELPDSFQVETKPSNFAVNQAVDLTITAIKNNQVMKNYEGVLSVVVEGLVDGKQIKIWDYIVPSGGVPDMKLSDQGVKTFSKGLSISKPGTFVISVEDIQKTAKETKGAGTTSVIVSNDATLDTKSMQVFSPSAGEEVAISMVSVIASATELPNARIQVLLNDLAIKEVTSDAQGAINATIEGLKVGTNYLQLKAISVAGETVGASEKVVFVYKPQTTDLLKAITATPNQNLKLWNKVRFELSTDENASSAKLIFPTGNEYPLDKEKDWLFTKDIMLTQTGAIDIGAEISAGAGTSKAYESILSLQVAENTQIGQVKILAVTDIPGALQLSWETLGQPTEYYAIQYGLAKDALEGTLLTTGLQATLSGFTYGKDYFFKVIPTNANYEPDGLPSEVIEFKMPIATGTGAVNEALSGSTLSEDHPVAPQLPTCVVKNIKVSTQKIGNKYYLVWNKVENATKYQIYKSDFADNSDKTFLGETDLTRFEYPFDKSVEEEVYAYYTVEAICTDGATAILTQAQKVQVWPLEDMMLILATTLLGYLLYRLYSYRI